MDEDCLAIHSVVAASYRVLRDLLERRGRSDLDEIMRSGIFHVAKVLADGHITFDKLGEQYEDETLVNFISYIAKEISNGKTLNDIELNVTNSDNARRKDWEESARMSNFLKHADRDPHDFLQLSQVDIWNFCLTQLARSSR